MARKLSKPRKDKKTEARFSWRKTSAVSRRAVQEFGPGKTDIVLCPEGDAVYYYKSWHHDLEKYRALSEDKALTFRLCPFHVMKKNRQWEGEVRIAKVPSVLKREIISAAENLSDEARRRDPTHGILDLKETDGVIRILTSENQLANRIARKIENSHKHHFTRTIHHGRESDAVLITLEWSS